MHDYCKTSVAENKEKRIKLLIVTIGISLSWSKVPKSQQVSSPQMALETATAVKRCACNEFVILIGNGRHKMFNLLFSCFVFQSRVQNFIKRNENPHRRLLSCRNKCFRRESSSEEADEAFATLVNARIYSMCKGWLWLHRFPPTSGLASQTRLREVIASFRHTVQ